MFAVYSEVWNNFKLGVDFAQPELCVEGAVKLRRLLFQNEILQSWKVWQSDISEAFLYALISHGIV